MARLVGNPAPYFKAPALVNGENKTVSLDDYKGKWKVLFFYPLDFTFVCPTEIIAYSDAADKFKSIGCELIACSVQPPAAIQATPLANLPPIVMRSHGRNQRKPSSIACLRRLAMVSSRRF